jgi:EAL domain-containing protein (putative c-di-GMP-specific phosphodiesterase class I)
MFILDQLLDVAKKMEKQIFWKIDEDNIIGDENFFEELLKKLEENEVKHKFTLMFNFSKKFKNFIQKCNDNNISIAINNFDANVKDIIFIERNELKFDFIKTNLEFVDGIHKEENWLDKYIDILESYKAKIIIDFIETKEMNIAVKARFGEKVFAFQGYGLRKPDYIDEYLKN